MAKTKLNPRSIQLLKHLCEQHPLGISCVHPVPTTDEIGHIGMVVMNGLLRRGYAEERNMGIYYVTQKGLDAYKVLEPPTNSDASPKSKAG